MNRLLRLFVGLLCIVGVHSTKIDEDTSLALRAAWNKTINVPFVKQPNDYTCGPTSLLMLMLHAGETDITVKSICSVITCGKNGISEEQFLVAAHHFGYKNAAWSSDDTHGSHIKDHVARGIPVATHMKVGPWLKYCDGDRSAYEGTYGHYIVVNGFVQSVTVPNAVHCVVSNDPARFKNTLYGISFWTAWTSPYGQFRYFVLGTK